MIDNSFVKVGVLLMEVLFGVLVICIVYDVVEIMKKCCMLLVSYCIEVEGECVDIDFKCYICIIVCYIVVGEGVIVEVLSKVVYFSYEKYCLVVVSFNSEIVVEVELVGEFVVL